jgi:4-aminobutyrate aminotransferase-like enzyme
METSIIKDRKEYLSTYDMYKEPLIMKKTSGQFCWDLEDKKYLDMYNNVYTVGYCNPEVVTAVTEQMSQCVINLRYVHPVVAQYAKELLATFPEELGFDVCYFVNSGSEANDLAMRMAKVYTESRDVAFIEGAYHGTTECCQSVTSSVSTGISKEHLEGYYRRMLKKDLSKEEIALRTEKVFIHETIQGVAGQIIFDKDFLPNVYEQVKKNGGLCIADEVQTGFGRTGDQFWVFEHYGLKPDFVTLGKGIGNGFPLGCLVTRKEIANKLGAYFNTFGGNPVSCMAGLTTLRIVLRENLQQNSKQMGEAIQKGVKEIIDEYKLPVSVRGLGLFIGIEFPSGSDATEIFEKSRENGILLGLGGEKRNIIRIKPPLCINSDDVSEFLKVFKKLVSSLYSTESTDCE